MASFENREEIPADLREACHWTGVVLMEGQKAGTEFSCREWEARKGGALRIAGAILDTSDRHEGVLLKRRFTYLEEGYYGGHVAWFIRPIRTEDS
jgi:hypothetical protein